MKKFLLLAFTTLLTLPAIAETRVAVVDLQQLVSSSTQVKQLKEDHSKKIKELEKIIINARGEISNENEPSKILLLEEKYTKEFNTKKEAIDKETENKLLCLANVIAEKGISTKFLEWKTRPHLTLACFNDVNEIECIERLKDFAKNHNKMPAYLSSIGMFNDTKTIFISPDMNSSMYQFHRELHEILSGFDSKGWEWYCPDGWVPHCTVALTGDDAEEAFYQASRRLHRS